MNTMTVRDRNFTTTLSGDILEWLNEFVSEYNISKKAVLSRLLENLRKEHRNLKIAQGYARAKDDLEMKELANAGLEDLLNKTKLWEQE